MTSLSAHSKVRVRQRPERPDATYRLPTTIVLGDGARAQLPAHLAELGITAPLVVTDAGVRAAGIIDQLEPHLADAGTVTIFDEVEADPSTATVTRIADVVAQEGCDGLVAVGGGSSMDAAKAAAALATNDATIDELIGPERVYQQPLPTVAVPTTAGTGSEVTRFAVLSDHERHAKAAVASFRIMPDVALLDPELTHGLPAHLTASTGLDALAHAIESYGSVWTHPISEGMALQAIELIGTHLRAAVQTGSANARYGMLIASCIAELAANTTRLGLAHALAVPLGATHHVPHGVAVGLLLPHMCEFNRPADPTRDARLTATLDPHASSLNEAVRRLSSDVEFRGRLRDWNVDEGDLDRVGQMAATSDNVEANPRVAELKDLTAMLRAAR